jgi:Fic family protein
LLTRQKLNLPDAGAVANVSVLDPRRHFVTAGKVSLRHRVIDNLLGTAALCPVIRRTRKLEDMMRVNIGAEVATLVAHADPDILARAVNYFYTKETKSSYAIEGDQVSLSRAERFVAALRAVKDFDLDAQSDYVELQNRIVDRRYAADAWRSVQNFIGEAGSGFQEIVHCVFPKPGDVGDLMAGLGALGRRLLADDVDPVLAAAAVSFAFVFIHPFEDGNGRIHRFLIHHVLARKGLTPPGMIFPVSSPIVRDQAAYDAALETFSRRIMPLVDWRWQEGEVVVENDTVRLYRYFDATAPAEYLYEKVIETVRVDLRDEIAFLSVFHRARRAVMERVDMPDRRADLFIRLCMQNDGRLSAAKRRQFAELTDREIADLETAIAQAREAQADGRQLTLEGIGTISR